MALHVDEVSFFTAQALMRRQRYDEAAALLKPMAANPHGGDQAVAAANRLDQIKVETAQAQPAPEPPPAAGVSAKSQ